MTNSDRNTIEELMDRRDELIKTLKEGQDTKSIQSMKRFFKARDGFFTPEELEEFIRDLRDVAKELEPEAKLKLAKEYAELIAKQVLHNPELNPELYADGISNTVLLYGEHPDLLRKLGNSAPKEFRSILLNYIYEDYADEIVGDYSD